MPPRIEIPRDAIADFCIQNDIRWLALFGSVLRDDFGPGSDVDVLVEFDSGAAVGLLDMARMERELAALLGHPVDLRTPQDLSRYFRQDVLASAEVQYERAG